MDTCIALFRGINVGGRNILPMGDLRKILGDLGLYDVRTYIQSGNVVFRGDDLEVSDLAETIGLSVEERRGFKPDVLLLDIDALDQALRLNPFLRGKEDPRVLHLGFLAAVPPDPDLEAMKEIQADSERFHLEGAVFYLYAPEGIGRSKLARGAEKALGVSMTMRNLRTILKVRSLVTPI